MFYLNYVLGNPQGDNPEDEDYFYYKSDNLQRLLDHLETLGNQCADWSIGNNPVNVEEEDYTTL